MIIEHLSLRNQIEPLLKAEVQKWQEKKLTLIVDTRESDPLFASTKNLSIVRKKLDVGDYSIAGLENLITVERKKQNDFENCLTNHRERFEKELLRGKNYICKAILIEGISFNDLLIDSINDVKFRVVLNSIISFMARGWNFFFAVDRVMAKYFVLYFLRKSYNAIRRARVVNCQVL